MLTKFPSDRISGTKISSFFFFFLLLILSKFKQIKSSQIEILLDNKIDLSKVKVSLVYEETIEKENLLGLTHLD